MRTLLLGAGLTLLAAAVLALVLGSGAFGPALAAGLLATVVQLGAGAAHRRWPPSGREVLGAGFALGFLVRLAGVGLFAVVAALRPDILAPLPAALAFTGVLFPLMVMETRTGR